MLIQSIIYILHTILRSYSSIWIYIFLHCFWTEMWIQLWWLLSIVYSTIVCYFLSRTQINSCHMTLLSIVVFTWAVHNNSEKRSYLILCTQAKRSGASLALWRENKSHSGSVTLWNHVHLLWLNVWLSVASSEPFQGALPLNVSQDFKR